MITILGAGGVIGNEVVKLLSARKQLFRLVGRNARPVSGATEVISADLSDKGQTIRAAAGSSIVSSRWSQIRPQTLVGNVAASHGQHH